VEHSNVFDPAFSAEAVLADAQRKESLSDWGPGEFERPLRVLLADYARADLNAIGTHIVRSGIVHSLRMRLRTQEWIRRHPEILDEQVAAPIAVVGMMRSGTTLLQRLLAADPRLICAYGWEVVEVAPRLDYQFSGVDPRIAVSEGREAKSRKLAPDLFAIHPMYAREAEEEIVFLADAFLSHVPESGAHLPHYRSWLDERDFTPAYEYLHRMMQFLQWQKRRRRPGDSKEQRWVLKSPAHLGYLDLLRAQFSDSGEVHVVHMHRDPRTAIASGANLNATLHAMHADTVDLHRVGAQWLQRMGWTNDRAMAIRDDWADGWATDIGFDAAVADPIGQVSRVYDAIGLPLTAEAEDAMRRWLHERPREAARPPYRLADHGLLPEQVDERFTLYNKRFRQYAGQ
jgi:hypothetical protein